MSVSSGLLGLLLFTAAHTCVIASAGSSAASAPLVQVAFYGEALCPYCVAFTLKSLAPLYDHKLIFSDTAIARLEYVPWGNARYDADSDTVSCQHGPRECELDAVFSCVLSQQTHTWFPFVHCVEKRVFKDTDTRHLVHRCASETGLDDRTILDCASGAEGRRLQLEAYRRTADLRPSHQGVPWVTVNGIPLQDDTANVLEYICAAYTGPRPAICFEPSPDDDDDDDDDSRAASIDVKRIAGASQAGFKMLFSSLRQLVRPLLVGGGSLEANRRALRL